MFSVPPIPLSSNRNNKNNRKNYSNQQQQNKIYINDVNTLQQTKQYFKKYSSCKDSEVITNHQSYFNQKHNFTRFQPFHHYKQDKKIMQFQFVQNSNPQSLAIKITNHKSKNNLTDQSNIEQKHKIIDKFDDSLILKSKQTQQLTKKQPSRTISRKNKTAGKLNAVYDKKSTTAWQNFRSKKKNNFFIAFQKTNQRQTSLSPSNSSESVSKNKHSRHSMQQMNKKLKQIRHIQQYAATYRLMTEKPIINSTNKIQQKRRVQTVINNNQIKSVLKISGGKNQNMRYIQTANKQIKTNFNKQEIGEKIKTTLDFIQQNRIKQMNKNLIPISPFHSTLKKKCIEDSPTALASAIRKKMQVLPRKDLYDYINGLMNKTKANVYNNSRSPKK